MSLSLIQRFIQWISQPLRTLAQWAFKQDKTNADLSQKISHIFTQIHAETAKEEDLTSIEAFAEQCKKDPEFLRNHMEKFSTCEKSLFEIAHTSTNISHRASCFFTSSASQVLKTQIDKEITFHTKQAKKAQDLLKGYPFTKSSSQTTPEEWAKSFTRVYGEDPKGAVTPPPPPKPPAEVMDVQDKTGGKKQGELQLSPGIHKIKILHGAKNGQTIDLQTSAPIYRFANAQFGGMSAPGNCLLMQKADFDRIKDMIHPGAFGSDVSHAGIGDGWVAVWKFPAELKEIAGWKASMEVVPNHVGTYHMLDDTTIFSKTPALPGNDTSSIAATKFRMDLPQTASGQSPSVHHLELPDRSQVAGFSTGNLFQDFNAPTPAERQKTETLLKELDAAGVKAFMCNGNHHLLVLYKNGSGQKMTPRDVADMLRGPQGPAIKAALKKAGKADFNPEEWAKSFINVYGEGPKGAVTPPPPPRGCLKI